MNLKNINSFKDFIVMRLNEEDAFGGNDFSNSTGFSKSLLGRGIFSLFRYFKQGINSFRLEFYKRELENEYLAGVLRWIVEKNVDISTGRPPDPHPPSSVSTSVSTPEAPSSTTCDTSRDPIVQNIGPIEQMNELQVSQAIRDFNDELENGKRSIIKMEDKQSSLDKLIELRKTYTGMPTTSAGIVDNLIKKLQDDITKGSISESIVNEEYKKTKITKGKLSIRSIYGDSLKSNKFDNVSVSDINWDGIAEYMRSNPNEKNVPTSLINKEALKEIQYGVSRMIYHTIRTPSDKGVNPGTGGGVSKQTSKEANLDTKLKTKWDKIVNNTMGLYRDVLVVDGVKENLIINPYKLVSLEEAYRTSSSDGLHKKEKSKTNGFIIETNLNELYIEKGVYIPTDIITDRATADWDKLESFGFLCLNMDRVDTYYAFKSYDFEPNGSGHKMHYMYPIDKGKLISALESKISMVDICKNYRLTKDRIFGNILDINKYCYMAVTDKIFKNSGQIKVYFAKADINGANLSVIEKPTIGTGTDIATLNNKITAIPVKIEWVYKIKDSGKWGLLPPIMTSTSTRNPTGLGLEHIITTIKNKGLS